jgi:hypothetical protein
MPFATVCSAGDGTFLQHAPVPVRKECKVTQLMIDGHTELAELEQTPPSAEHLRWEGATPTSEQMAFMRQVYALHVQRAAASGRRYVPDVAANLLGPVEGSVQLLRPAAAALKAMLTEARAALAQGQRAGDVRAREVQSIGVTSGYRPASHQFSIWQRNFPRYYSATTRARAAMSGGPHGRAAAEYLMRYVGARVAAPGFSLHNEGKAADLITVDHRQRLTASSDQRAIAAWRRSWFFEWLARNAARFGFYQNPSIDEPWHWEFRGAARGTTPVQHVTPQPAQQAAAAQLLQALPRLVQTTPTVPAPAYRPSAPSTAAGRDEIAQLPLLDHTGGNPPAVVIRWNGLSQPPTVVDVVLHFHGYARCGQPARIVLSRDIEPISGLDFRNPAAPTQPGGRSRPTLGILPRGTLTGPEANRRYTFPALAGEGLQQLMQAALMRFGQRAGLSQPPRAGRLILTAHSGGGAALLRALATLDPHEVHIFDGLYGWPQADYANLINWVKRRVARDQTALSRVVGAQAGRYMHEQGGAIRALVWDQSTLPQATALDRVVRAALAPSPHSLAGFYRVERTAVKHCHIPRTYGWRLLADAGADLPQTARL